MSRPFAIALVILLFGAAAHAQRNRPNGVAAVVNDSVITLAQVEETAESGIQALRRTPGLSDAAFEKRYNEILTESMDALVNRQLILDDFTKEGNKVPENFLDDQIKDRIRKRFGDRITLIRSLQARGLTYESFRKQEHDALVLEIMRHRKVSQAVLISPKKIEQYYQTNLAKYQIGEQIKTRMITLNAAGMGDEVKRIGLEIWSILRKGEDFAQMAGIYSEDGQRGVGGDAGWRERSFMKKGLSDLIFNLDAGTISPLIGEARDTDQNTYWILTYSPEGALLKGRKYGAKDEFLLEKTFAAGDEPPLPVSVFYLFQVEGRRAAHTRTLVETRDEIEKDLLVQERARLMRQWVERLRKKAFIRFF